ncbi:hypothetical protein MSM1_20390 [Mycobacterium sp. SM1]|uniref:hypothetical protein n=1 Tax=Mycobacterium sp. SM1 TaxID=2816243 RepID=UPI001BCAC0DB|nr:hypothetical protein [Mycobacterium sp. SM1]MBS4730577.1 hypothetical protein [Mycobacterium sp. SM1]
MIPARAPLAAPDQQLTIIDTPPGSARIIQDAIDAADLVLVPCGASPADVQRLWPTTLAVSALDVLPTAEAGGFQPVYAAGAAVVGWSSNSSRFPAGSCFGDRARPAGLGWSSQAVSSKLVGGLSAEIQAAAALAGPRPT